MERGAVRSSNLSALHVQALFDILTHHESYSEIQALRHSHVIRSFGSPLQLHQEGAATSSPLLQTLLFRFILNLPGLRDVNTTFWNKNVADLVSELADCNLSESYDKGAIGIRKTLSTATAALVESVSRGVLGGYSDRSPSPTRQYDSSKFEDIEAAWAKLLQQAIKGELIDDLFAKVAETDKLSDHDTLIQKAHEYALIMLASFMHYILVVSPRGQTMLPLLIRANGLLPYFMIRQTLKVGNAASMISGMVRIILVKMNMSSITSWIGGTPSDSGMNLLQYIISTVLNWDVNVLKKRATNIERHRGSLEKTNLDAIQAYCQMIDSEQENLREHSRASRMHQLSTRAVVSWLRILVGIGQDYAETPQESMNSFSWFRVIPMESEMVHGIIADRKNIGRSRCSMIDCIVDKQSKAEQLSQAEHTNALEYLAIQLAIRDREKLVQLLCHHEPDILTSTVRLLVAAYDPIIRSLHKAVDLSTGVYDLQCFLDDLIKLSRMDHRAENGDLPTVEDFCKLLRKHAGSSHRFLHQMLKNSPELRQCYLEYAHKALSQYRSKTPQDPNNGGAGDASVELRSLYENVSLDDRAVIAKELDAYVGHMSKLQSKSAEKLKTVVENLAAGKSETTLGPGIYLAKWQALIDETAITPESMTGPVRTGNSKSVKDATRIDIDGGKKGLSASQGVSEEASDLLPVGCSETVRLLGPAFRELLNKSKTI